MWSPIRLALVQFARVFAASALVLALAQPQSTDGQSNDAPHWRADHASVPRFNFGTAPGMVWNPAAERPSAAILVASFPDTGAAAEMFKTVTNRLPAAASLTLFGESLLLSLPQDRDDLRKQWRSEFADRSTNVFEDTAGRHAAFSLVCQAPDAKTAEALVSQLDDYLKIEHSRGLIPPWQSSARYPATNRAHDELARQTLVKFLKAMYDYENPDLNALGEELRHANQTGDESAAIRLHGEYQLLDDQLRRKNLDAVRNGLRGPVDTNFADLYLARMRAVHDPSYGSLSEELDRRLGQFPLVNGQLAPEDKRIAGGGGWVSRDGLTISVTFMSFYDLVNGPATLVHWLADGKCFDFKYDYVFEFDWQPGFVFTSPGRFEIWTGVTPGPPLDPLLGIRRRKT